MAAVVGVPYDLEFLGLAGEAAERRLEDGLVAHLQRFLLELGAGFAFVGRQYRLEVAGTSSSSTCSSTTSACAATWSSS